MVMKPLTFNLFVVITQDYDAMRGCEWGETSVAIVTGLQLNKQMFLKGIISTKYQLLEKVFRNQYKILTVQLP